MSEVSVEWDNMSQIDQGGFAAVYRGKLKNRDKTDIAIKKLHNLGLYVQDESR